MYCIINLGMKKKYFILFCLVFLSISVFSQDQKPYGFGKTEAEIRDSLRANTYLAFSKKGYTTDKTSTYITYLLTTGDGEVFYFFNKEDVCWMYVYSGFVVQLNYAIKSLEKNFNKVTENEWRSKDWFTAAQLVIDEDGKQFSILYVDKTPK